MVMILVLIVIDENIDPQNGFLNRRRRTEVKSSVELIGESDWKGKYKRYHLSAIHH
jgi:hypothetical protein